MLAWWRDVIKESNEGYHTKIVQIGLRYGMILFIASEVMFFVAWFWAFRSDACLVARRHQGVERGVSHEDRPDRPPLRHDPVHRLGGDVLRRLVLGLPI